jgi:cytochrome c-type biogenesis protein CcmF
MDIAYQGENIVPGMLGHFFVILSFAATLISTFAFFKAYKHGDDLWKTIGRFTFRIHSLSILGIIAALFYMLFNHMYEYDYVWKHSSNIMPMRYIMSCFWEGQEGSLILWSFWHAVLANILIYKAGKWEAGVLTVIAAVQAFLASMLLGVYVGDFQIGINPFLLVRETAENFGLPWTVNPNYLTEFPLFADGRGLNPLLQNYWMTIHPPTLFLGFASTLVPFAFAIAGLWKKEHKEWMSASLPWAFFGVMILGTGILMGGAWAYEALSFGGFWAWDPVENSSLVPWLVLVAGAHLMLINKRKATSLFSTYLMILLSFILVLYSTFLTRSGVLGDSSVHSFVDSGILPQLLLFLVFFGVLAFGMMLGTKARKTYWITSVLLAIACIVATISGAQSLLKIPIIVLLVVSLVMLVKSYIKNWVTADTEEHLWSREFWVFVGSLVLFLSSLQIIIWTSLPITNIFLEPFSGAFSWLHESTGLKFFKNLAEHNFAPPTNREAEYNRWQVPFAVIITLLIAAGQFFSYKFTDIKKVMRKLTLSAIFSAVCTLVIIAISGFAKESIAINALLFSTIFAASANLDYFVRILKGNWGKAGSSLAHIGFGLLLLGALISTSQSKVISVNSSIYDVRSLSEDLDNNQDIVMFEGDTLQMGKYFAMYNGSERQGINQVFRVDYFKSKPVFYQKGDVVFHKDMIFEALEDHQASPEFIEDMELKWQFFPFPNERQSNSAKIWRGTEAGEPEFTLYPLVQLNERMGNAPEPDTRHYIYKDVYTHIKWGRTEAVEVDEQGYLEAFSRELAIGDTIIGFRSRIIVDSLVPVLPRDKERYKLVESDIAAKAILRISEKGRDTIAEPLFILRDSTMVVPDICEIPEFGLKFSLDKIDPSTGKMTITTAEHSSNQRDFIVMQAIEFPMINVLWIGCIIMVIGSTIAVRHRILVNRKSVQEES